MSDTLHLAGIPIRAVSVAGLETFIELPSWRVCFDIGRGHRQTVRNHTVLFTHAHIDHMGGIAHHVATRGLLNMAPPTYVVPKAIADNVENLLMILKLQVQSLQISFRVEVGFWAMNYLGLQKIDCIFNYTQR